MIVPYKQIRLAGLEGIKRVGYNKYFPVKYLKISTKAVIIRNDKILMIEKSPKSRQNFYTLPGGTQETKETLHRSLAREVFEETGAAKIEIQNLIWTSERKVQSKREKDKLLHKIEYIFRCSIEDGYKAKMGPIPDSNQTGVKWLKIEKLDQYRIAPKRLRVTLNDLLTKVN